MTKSDLRNKLLTNLGENYSPYIDQVIDIISVVISENYFTYEQLVKYLKEKSDIEQEIGDQPKYIPTDRGKGVKVNPVYRELQRVEKEIVRLSKSISKKSKKQQKEEQELPFEIDNELECAVYMLIFACQFLGDKNYDDIEERKANSMYPIICKNPLYNESLTYDDQYKIVNEIIDKYHEEQMNKR